MEQIFLKIMLRHLENKELTNSVAFYSGVITLEVKGRTRDIDLCKAFDIVLHNSKRNPHQNHGQQVERDDSPPLLCIHEIIPLAVLSALGPEHKGMDLLQ